MRSRGSPLRRKVPHNTLGRIQRPFSEILMSDESRSPHDEGTPEDDDDSGAQEAASKARPRKSVRAPRSETPKPPTTARSSVAPKAAGPRSVSPRGATPKPPSVRGETPKPPTVRGKTPKPPEVKE